MLADEPALSFIGTDDLAHEQVVGTVIAALRRLPRKRPRLNQDEFMGIEQMQQFLLRSLSPARTAADPRFSTHVLLCGQGDTS